MLLTDGVQEMTKRNNKIIISFLGLLVIGLIIFFYFNQNAES